MIFTAILVCLTFIALTVWISPCLLDNASRRKANGSETETDSDHDINPSTFEDVSLEDDDIYKTTTEQHQVGSGSMC